ncbi:hypothetical protein NGTWS0302_23910 [Mycolicibacterium cyprinidarum]|uniref:Uncharacterized protein n=1 Tax=Mycolicibacterium cyprinidarum TaxID=2860311 RepID=A0ABQ4VCG6_9MYCO|nr:hypothetical protein NGTWS0302_23910 [Mycolicibacterium sp. NGTWS0302]GJF19553.1 hypothetical protein NGTWS1702_28270 [Mycolicibacterium sp. NGTWSNA01]
MNTTPDNTAATPPCGYLWCRNDKPEHVEHYGDGSTTGNYSGPGSAEIECSAYVTAESGGPYPDEIHLHIKTTNPGTDHAQNIDQGVGVFLTDDEARELRRLIDTALANRAEIRGQMEVSR